MLRALTFDYWDTLYEGGALPERVALRRTAVGALLGAYGRALPEEQLRTLYEESGREAERWWREEQRGYSTNDRLHWILERADVAPRDACEHVATAAEAVDNALLGEEQQISGRRAPRRAPAVDHALIVDLVLNDLPGVFRCCL